MGHASLVGSVLSVLLIFQASQQAPPRDQSADAKKNTAVVRGRVTAADTGAPLHGVSVMLRSSELKEPRAAVTDAEGRYEIKNLPAGRFMVIASPSRYRAMYLGTIGASAARDRGPRIVEVAAGQLLKDVDFALVRALAVTGRVVDEFGDPMSNMRVALIPKGAGNAAAVTIGDGTDDLGRFRLFGLEAGEYYVRAEIPAAQVSIGLDSSQVADEYVPTYYPGTPNLAEAPAVKLEPDQELPDLMIRMIKGRAYRIAGLVLDAEGRPVSAAAIVMSMLISQSPMPSMRGATCRPDGTFEFGKMPPGDYTLAARLVSDQPQMSKPVRVTVAAGDVENVTLVITPGVTLAGRIITDGGAVPAFRPTGAVTARPIQLSNILAATALSGAIRDDWTFEITGARVPVLLRLPAQASGDWRLKSVRYRDADITNVPTDFTESTAAADLTIVLTSKGAKLEGVVLDASGRPMPGTAVTLFPEDTALRFFQSTQVRTATTDEQGRYKLEKLPAGSYRILASARSPLDGVAMPDASTFEALDKPSTAVTLEEDEQKALNLVLAKLER